jgi:ferredoxin
MKSDDRAPQLTRRRFGQAMGLGLAAGAEVSWMAFAHIPASAQTTSEITMKVAFRVNGQAHSLAVDPRTTLLDAVREHLGLIGTKKGCDHGQCGACTAIVDGRRMNTCLSLAVMHESSEIDTIEGLGLSRNCTRCRRPSSRTTAISADIARRARSSRRSRHWTRSQPASRVQPRAGCLSPRPRAPRKSASA